jgi:aspartyl-tRNA(Asn)/glutamyl-tRNA(Gln) amidotransferase subunit C
MAVRLDKEQIQKIAHLARLELSEKELEDMEKDMEKILEFVARVDELDLEGVEPLKYVNPEWDKLRADTPSDPVTKEEALKNAPDRDTDYFRFPKVVKLDEEE